MQQLSDQSWWPTFNALLTLASTVVTGAATAVLAWFAWEQMQAEKRRKANASRSADTRINTLAYQLRRQLRSWVGTPAGNEVGLYDEAFERWILDARNAHTFGEHLDRAEGRLDELMKLRPDASPAIGAALDRACLLFLEGARRLNEYIATPRPGNDRIFEWVQLRLDAEKDFRACIAELEQGVIARSLLEAERTLAAERESGSVLGQIAAQFQGVDSPKGATPKPAGESPDQTPTTPKG